MSMNSGAASTTIMIPHVGMIAAVLVILGLSVIFVVWMKSKD